METELQNPTIDLLLRRRSLVAAKMSGPGPDDSELEQILRCAVRVPDHGKLAPWRLDVFRAAGRDRLGGIFAAAFKAKEPEAPPGAVQAEYDKALRAPVVLVASTRIVSERIPRWEQVLSGGALCQNALVAASALGYRGQWLSEWPAYDEKVKGALGIPPSDEVLGFIYIGSCVEEPRERVRPVLEDVVGYWDGDH